MSTPASPLPVDKAEAECKNGKAQAALWSGLQPARESKSTMLSTGVLGLIMASCMLLEVLTEGRGGGLLSSHNGQLMKFFKSLHAINHYWYRARYISRSVVGCMLLKFIGSSLVSLALGKQPSWIDHPSYIISFLLAFCLVRSDSLEAHELSGHMRYVAPATVALNLLAALYKMRSLSHLVDQSDVLGVLGTLVFGTIAFSACNMLMVAEARLLELYGRSARRGSPLPSVQTPIVSQTLMRHFAYLALLLGARATLSRLVYLMAKVIILTTLFSNYNKGLLKEPIDGTDSSDSIDAVRVIRNPSYELIMSTMSIPTRAKRAHNHTSLFEGMLRIAALWVVGLATLGDGVVMARSRSSSLLQKHDVMQGLHSTPLNMPDAAVAIRHRLPATPNGADRD